MGIYDRDYVRDEDQGYGGGPWSMVGKLVAINVAIYLVQILFFQDDARKLTDLFGLKSDLFARPWQCYQLLSYGFLHSDRDVMHIVINMLLLWFFGREMETIYGGRVFLEFYLSTIILAGLAWVVFQQALIASGEAGMGTLIGASGGVTGVVLVAVLHDPRRTILAFFFIPMPLWLFACILLVPDVLYALWPQPGDEVARSAHLAGAALGYLFYRTRWQLGMLLPTRLFASLGRPKVRIHREEDEEPDDDAALKAEVDKILEKISREGEASLTSRERRTLEDASRRYQKRRR